MNGAGQPARASEERAQTAARLARLAGEMALERFESAQVSWKIDDSMVTNADVEIQSWLEKEIGSAFPDDGILGEEGLGPGPHQLDAPHVWVLDPIDGTNNFGRGIPGFCVSVGVLRHGMPFAGAVCDPVAGHLFRGSAGCGAWLNERRLRVAPAPLSGRSLFSIRAPFSGPVPAAVAGWLSRHRLRRVGSTALQLCYVALGALAFVHDHGASLWDVAGAASIVTEAGGVLTSPEGAPLFPVRAAAYRGEALAFLAGDPLAHAESLASLTR